MADLQRGQRIKARREELGYSQPEVVEEVERLAWALDPSNRLHPENPKAKGKPPVTLRGYQSWEAGGGIDPGKAKLLAEALQATTRELVNGIPSDAPTPTPFAGPDATAELHDTLSGVLREIKDQLAEQTMVLEEIKGYAAAAKTMLEEQKALKAETDELLPLMRAVAEGLPQADAAERLAAPAPSAPAKT